MTAKNATKKAPAKKAAKAGKPAEILHAVYRCLLSDVASV
jgi:hypothetical protein